MPNHHSKRTFTRRVARQLLHSVAPAALLAAPAPARALPGENVLSAGVFVGHQFGPSGGFEFGLELLGTRLFGGPFYECGSDQRTGAGGLLQIGLLSFHDVRFSLAAHGGHSLGQQEGPGLGVELGLSYRLGSVHGLGIHSGLLGELSILNAAFRYQWLRNEAWAGLGLRYLPTYVTLSHCEVGRPLRTDHGRAYLATPSVRVPRALGDEALARQHDAGRRFERDAQLEAASVPAFVQLARELSALDAPTALIGRALESATDELRHAALCAGLATRYVEERVEPSWPLLQERKPRRGKGGLIRLAVESWIDGCLMEGIAAAHAAAASRAARDPHARAVQTHIARDEHRHAELAWSILRWAIERGGRAVRNAVFALRDAEVMAVDATTAPAELQGLGRLDHAALNAIAAAHRRTARERLTATLAAV